MIKPYLFLFLLSALIGNAQNTAKIDSLHQSFDHVIYVDLNKSLENAQEAIRLSEILQVDSLLLTSYSNMSKAFYLSGMYKESQTASEKALSKAINLNEQKAIGILYNRLGAINRRQNAYIDALKYYQDALSIAEEYNFKPLKSLVYKSLAQLSRSKGEDSLAFVQLDRAIKISENNNYKEILAESYNLKGTLYYASNKDSSFINFNKSLAIYRSTKDKYHQGIELANLGDLFISTGNFQNAINYLTEAETTFIEVGANHMLHNINMSLGVYYEYQDDMNNAVIKYEKALFEYGEFADGFQKKHDYWLLSGAYFHQNEFQKAFNVQEKYIALSDSLFSIEKEREFDEIRTIYEVEKKDTAIKLLENEKVLARTKQKWIIICSLILLFPLILLFIFYRHRAHTQLKIRQQEKKIHSEEKQRLQKEQELAEIKALLNGQDKERNRIAKELHDGVGGQLASVNLSLSHLNNTLENKKILEIGTNLTQSLKELRLLSHNLSANSFIDRDFDMLLENLKNQYENPKQFEVEISIYPKGCFEMINVDIKHNLYRILQETLANVSKHANANFVSLSFTKHHENLTVLIEDDGIGFDYSKGTKGIGIKNIKERLFSINGTIEIDSSHGVGTHLILEIPTNTIFKNNG